MEYTKDEVAQLYLNHFINYDEYAKYDNGIDKSYVIKALDKVADKKYVSFLYRVIKYYDIYFFVGKGIQHCVPVQIDDTDATLCSIKITQDNNAFFHEIGHGVDFGFLSSLAKIDKSYYNKIDFYSGKDLYNVLLEEFGSQWENIYNDIERELLNSLDEEFYEGFGEVIRKNAKDYASCNNIKVRIAFSTPEQKEKHEKKMDKLRAIRDRLTAEGIFEAFKQYVTSKSLTNIRLKYDVLIDAVSAYKDVNLPFGLGGHSPKYYKQEPSNLSIEFFANLFSDTILGNNESINTVKKYLPKSYEEFMKTLEAMDAYSKFLDALACNE